MAEMTPITLRLNEHGIDQLMAIFSHLYQENQHMTQQVTDLQAFSTAQVERIRSLESELARMKENP